MANAKISLDAPLNRKWWDEAKETVRSNLDTCTDFESVFYHDVTSKEISTLADGFEWNPTVKQFNFMRELARKLK